MARYVENLFRYWLRFAVILIVLPVPASAATLLYFRTVQATTNIWVQDPSWPTGSSVNAVAGWNQYLTPAQNVNDQLGQYLQTKSFQYSVADKLTGYGVSDAKERTMLIDSIGKNMHLVPNGTRLLTINFSCENAGYCTAMLSATIDVFQNRLTEALKAQETLTTSFLQAKLDDAQKRYDTSKSALENYLAAHPGVFPSGSGQATGNATLDGLAIQEQRDQAEVTALQNQLGQAKFTFAAADKFIQNEIQVVDPPRISAGGILGDGSSLKRAAIVWLVAIGVAAVYLALLVWMDKAARDTRELVGRLSVPILATVPVLAGKEKF